jgi:hypothetical protein
MIKEEKLKEGELVQEVLYGTTYHFIVKHGKKVKHREGGPAVDGEREKEWYLWGKRHNENGPARISWAWTNDIIRKPVFHPNGERAWNEQWFFSGQIHRIGAPALIVRNGDGYEAWYKHGILHRMDGPAETGCVKSYWINGYKFNNKDYLKAKIATRLQKTIEKYIQKICVGRCILTGKDSTVIKGFERGSYKEDVIRRPAPWDID